MKTQEKPHRSNHLGLLANEFANRKQRNPGYSLRAFAKHAGVSASILSEVLNGRRTLSKRSAFRIADRLFTSGSERSDFLQSALGIYADGDQISVIDATSRTTYDVVDADQFRMISEWYHLAILNLAKITPNSSDPDWVAKRLGITKRDARQALERLERMGLIAVTKKRFKRTANPIFVKTDIPSSVIRKYHRDNLEKAAEALESVPMSQRDFSSITIATTPHKVRQAGKLIQEFREQLSELLESAEQARVYTLAIQLFPVDRLDEESP